MRPNDQDLCSEEQSMPAMSFGEHIEELRARIILALMGLAVGVVLTVIPPLSLGWRVLDKMQAPAKVALTRFYKQRTAERARKAAEEKKITAPVHPVVPADEFLTQLGALVPKLRDDLPPPESLKGKTIVLPLRYPEAELIASVGQTIEPPGGLVSLAPLETITIFFMVCLVTGLVVASPWVFYQLWAFVAAGLYRHERHYVRKFLPFSLGLFLAGVFLCFFGVLPITLTFLLEFNVWLGIEPTLRLSDWMSFATILPLVFGVCFQTPLIMYFLERIGIFTADDYRSKRRIAILVMVVAAAVLTPGPDVFSQCMLAVPMIGLYELGIFLVREQKPAAKRPTAAAH